jgi:hypothetical protein
MCAASLPEVMREKSAVGATLNLLTVSSYEKSQISKSRQSVFKNITKDVPKWQGGKYFSGHISFQILIQVLFGIQFRTICREIKNIYF